MTAFFPSFAELARAASAHGHAIVSAAVVADGDTPLSLFARLRSVPGGQFLFESVEGGERTGRWSFFGGGLHEGLRLRKGRVERFGVRNSDCATEVRGASEIRGDLLARLREELGRRQAFVGEGLPPFTGGLVGFVGFDALASFELVPLAARGEDEPDAEWFAVDELYAYDHATHRLHALARMPLGADFEARLPGVRASLERRLAALAEPMHLAPFSPDPVTPELPRRAHREQGEFEAAVQKAKDAILAGEVFQVVLSQRWTVEAAVDPFSLYRALRALNPSPYMFLLRRPEGPALVGASPEVLVKVEGRQVSVRPIAGTRRRGKDTAEDLALERELRADPKEIAEHTMLLDLGRNDVGRVAKQGTVRVEAPMHVERYAHVMHLVSDVLGELAEGHDNFDAFRAGFPAGTVVGAPKLRAAELIAELEPHRRGPYAGAVGYFDHSGGMDTCIAIRTVIVHEDRVEVQAGAGIVADSDPTREHEECENKARSPLAAVALAAGAKGPKS